MALACKKCPYVVSVPPGEKPPPWCPRCGSDLKAAEAVQARPSATKPVSAWDATAPTGAVEAKTSAVVDEKARPLASSPGASEPTPAPVLTSDIPSPAPIKEELFRGNLLWQAAGVLSLLLCLGIVAIAASQLIQPRPGKPIQTGVYGVLGLFGIGALVAAYVTYRLLGQKYKVSDDGLVEWQSFVPTRYRWEQIGEVFMHAQITWTNYRVVTRGGRDFTIRGEISRHKKLGEIIAARVAQLLLPEALRELEAGRELKFGPLRISRAGVVVGGQLEPWHRIGILSPCLNPNPKMGTSIVSNMLHLRIGTSWVELSEVPNFRLFEEIAGRLFPNAVPTGC